MTAPLEIMLVPLRSGGRYRARATGTGPDGEQLVVVRESWDRLDVVMEAARAWFQAAERVQRSASAWSGGPRICWHCGRAAGASAAVVVACACGAPTPQGGVSADHNQPPISAGAPDSGAEPAAATEQASEYSSDDNRPAPVVAHRDANPANVSAVELDRLVRAADELVDAALEREALLRPRVLGVDKVVLALARAAVEGALARRATETISVSVGDHSAPADRAAASPNGDHPADHPPPRESQGKAAPEPDLVIAPNSDSETARVRPGLALALKNRARIRASLNPDTDCDPNGGGGPAAA